MALPAPHERFCVAYVLLELTDPESKGNGAAAYAEAYPGSKTNNGAYRLLQLESVQSRIAELRADAQRAEHVVFTGAYQSDYLYRAAELAKANQDAPTMLRAIELADRGRLGGPKLQKKDGRGLGDNPFTGKTPAEIQAHIDLARKTLENYRKSDNDDKPEQLQ